MGGEITSSVVKITPQNTRGEMFGMSKKFRQKFLIRVQVLNFPIRVQVKLTVNN